jgi:hypothetical protein
VAGEDRRVWPSVQMMAAKGKVETPDEVGTWRMGRVAEEEERMNLIVKMPYGVRFSRLRLFFSFFILFTNHIHLTVLLQARFSDHLDGHLHPDFTEGETFQKTHGPEPRVMLLVIPTG